MADSSFAVIDLETTGLSRAEDRIIEIAVVLLDEKLSEESHWHTLVNPERSAGATHIHGIHDADLASAPTFRELLPRLLPLLDKRRIVAHNAAFERAFLNSEFARAGLPHVIGEDSCVCTMDQSRIYLPPGPHSLQGVASRLGLPFQPRHRALHDAVVCAELLRRYLTIEAAGQRYTSHATNREGSPVLPAQWERAHGWTRSH
ncbi:3'-5' exonuclease [Trueperella pecoris]|uniref:3'-5' exonuclease n=1 Tax=Trueperella pecoris TaxID=2733571 RepID=A0A7M1R301_9ACTO|nr:3'-5' exonuclease [Trueperella pecoris]QOR48523.1 3'-5' exonuclease [Trueperella pecoris]